MTKTLEATASPPQNAVSKPTPSQSGKFNADDLQVTVIIVGVVAMFVMCFSGTMPTLPAAFTFMGSCIAVIPLTYIGGKSYIKIRDLWEKHQQEKELARPKPQYDIELARVSL